MEFSLHRQLKQVYRDTDDEVEVRLGSYRIDVVKSNTLVEIQSSSLSAIRSKIQRLIRDHHVTVVKPIFARKWIVRKEEKGGKVLGRRLSPKKGSYLSLFEEFVSFARMFPHKNLALEMPVVEVEETRYPESTAKRRRRRRRRKDAFCIEDLSLVSIERCVRLTTTDDLLALLPMSDVPSEFDTQQLADVLGIGRWLAQKIAFCLRETDAVSVNGKRGNAICYRQRMEEQEADSTKQVDSAKQTASRTPEPFDDQHSSNPNANEPNPAGSSHRKKAARENRSPQGLEVPVPGDSQADIGPRKDDANVPIWRLDPASQVLARSIAANPHHPNSRWSSKGPCSSWKPSSVGLGPRFAEPAT